MKLQLLIPMLTGLAYASPTDAPALRLNDMPEALLWNVRSTALRLCGMKPAPHLTSRFPEAWRPGHSSCNSIPPGGLIVLQIADIDGDSQPEYVLHHSIETYMIMNGTAFVCDTSLHYRCTIPLSQFYKAASSGRQSRKVYATTLHELLSCDTPRWIELREASHSHYRDAIGTDADYMHFLTPDEALKKLNERLGLPVTPSDTDIPCPLFPTRLKHYKNLPPHSNMGCVHVPLPEGELPLPTLQNAPKTLLHHLLSCSAEFDFEDQVQNEYELTNETRGGEIRVIMRDLFGGPEAEYMLTYHAPLCYGGEAPSHPPTFIFDHNGCYRYTIHNSVNEQVPIFHQLSEAVKKGQYTAGEDTWEKTRFENGVRYIWYQHELHETYARLVIWHSFECFDKKNDLSTPPQQIELICTADGIFRTDSTCAAGRPANFRFMDYNYLLHYICESDLRLPQQPSVNSPYIRTSLHEFLTNTKPRWIVTEDAGKLPEEMRNAAATYTTPEAVRALNEHLQK